MKELTATEAARNLSAVLDGAESGETVVITRGGRPVAYLVPAPRANGAALKALARKYAMPLADGEPDPHLEVQEWLRSIPPELDRDPWRD